MGKHTLEIEYDYDFLLIGIASHEKDYRIAWAINKALGLSLTKQNSLEIKGKKQTTPSFFSFFLYENEDAFKEYAVVANLSESKVGEKQAQTLFSDSPTGKSNNENEYLIPEQKLMNYFFMVRGEVESTEGEEVIKKLKEMEPVQTVVRIDAKSLKSKQNLVF